MTAKKKDAPVTFDIEAVDLLRGLHNSRLFASSDGYLPTICATHVEATATDVAFVSTDRYSIGVTTVPCSAAPFKFLMRGSDAALLLKLFTASSGTLTVKVDGSTLTVEPAEGMTVGPQVVVTCRAEDGEFPKWRDLLEKASQPKNDRKAYDAGTALGLNPKYLARFARVRSDIPGRGTDATTVRVQVFHTDTPVLVRVGNQFLGALMPVRIPESAVVSPKSSAA